MYNKNLYSILEGNKSLCFYLFEFGHNHSTNITLVEITEQIEKACDKALFAGWVCLDLKDIVNHGIQTKVDHYGVKGIAIIGFVHF